MIFGKKAISFVFITVIFICGCASNLRLNQDFMAENINLKTFAVMPPEIDFCIKYNRKEKPKPEYAVEINRIVQDAIANVLNKEGINVVSSMTTDSLLKVDQKFAPNLSRAKQSFDKVCDSIMRHKDKTISDTLDTDLGEIAARVQTDYLVFVKGSGYQRPRTVMNMMISLLKTDIGHNQLNGLFLEIAIVNTKTSEVLWFNRNNPTESNYDPLQISSVEVLCQKLLKNLFQS